MGKINIKSNNITGIKYLHIDNYAKYGNLYVVRLYVKGKVFVVWRGNEINIGKEVVKEMLKYLRKSDGAFIDWYDNKRKDWLEYNGY